MSRALQESQALPLRNSLGCLSSFSTRSGTTARCHVSTWRCGPCFWGGEQRPLPQVIHQASLPVSNPCAAVRGLPKDAIRHEWHTEAERPLHLWLLTKLLHERRGRRVAAADWEHRSSYWFVSFSSPSRAGSCRSFWRARAVRGPEAEQRVWRAGGSTWGGFAVITANASPSTRSSAIDFAPFSCHQAESRLSSSESCIRKTSAEAHCTSTDCSASSRD